MSSTDELREVQVEIRGTEHAARHGHQMNIEDRDPAAMNDHVKVRRDLPVAIQPIIRSLQRRANARNFSFETLYGGWFTLST